MTPEQFNELIKAIHSLDNSLTLMLFILGFIAGVLLFKQ